jgi:hypothetical protein
LLCRFDRGGNVQIRSVCDNNAVKGFSQRRIQIRNERKGISEGIRSLLSFAPSVAVNGNVSTKPSEVDRMSTPYRAGSDNQHANSLFISQSVFLS